MGTHGKESTVQRKQTYFMVAFMKEIQSTSASTVNIDPVVFKLLSLSFWGSLIPTISDCLARTQPSSHDSRSEPLVNFWWDRNLPRYSSRLQQLMPRPIYLFYRLLPTATTVAQNTDRVRRLPGLDEASTASTRREGNNIARLVTEPDIHHIRPLFAVTKEDRSSVQGEVWIREEPIVLKVFGLDNTVIHTPI